MFITSLILTLACSQTSYSNNFNRNVWGKFEEPINACYTTNAGQVVQQNGAMRITANAAGTYLSNHVIAQHKVNFTGTWGRMTYRIDFYIDADGLNNLTFPQTGPEVSVQNTRQINSSFITNTVGIQYVANPWDRKWNVWTEISPGVAGWVQFQGPTLVPRSWYSLTLKANFNTNTYTSAMLCRGGSCQLLPIGGLDIADELKWSESALWLTAEAENLWQSQCGGAGAQPLSATVLYDNVNFAIK